MSILKQELNETPVTLNAAEDLAVKVLSKTLDMTKLTSEKGEIKLICLRKYYKILKHVCIFFLQRFQSKWPR